MSKTSANTPVKEVTTASATQAKGGEDQAKAKVSAVQAKAKKSTKATQAPQVQAPKPQAQPAPTPTAESYLTDNTVFTITVPIDQIMAAKEQSLQYAQLHVKQEGFRKGKAPRKIVEQRLGESGLREMIVERVLPPAYSQAIKTNNYVPLTEPDISLKEAPWDQDWVFQVAIAQPPQVELGDYPTQIKTWKAKHELWQDLPADADDQARQERRQQQISAILGFLLENHPIKLPELLVRRETEHQLHQLQHQLEHMGLDLPAYLERTKQTQEALQQEIAMRALTNLQVEFLLAAIINQARITATSDELSTAVPKYDQLPEEQRQRLIASLLKQKAVDHLMQIG